MKTRFPVQDQPAAGELTVRDAPRETSSVFSRRAIAGALLGGAGLAALTGCGVTTGEATATSNLAMATAPLAFADLVAGTAGLRSINGDAAQVVIVEGYHAVGDGGGGLFAWVPANPIPADDGGSVIVPATTDPTNPGYWKRIFDGPISVRYFGAIGDNHADDTNAITAAINFAQASGGAELFFPPGVYRADGLVINQANMTLRGAGKSSILVKNAATNALITIGAVPLVTIRDLSLTSDDGQGGYTGWAIFCAASASFLTLDNLYIYSIAYGIGLEPAYPSQVHNAVIRNCMLNQISQLAIALFNCIDTFISDSGIFMFAYLEGSTGLQVDTGTSGVYTNNLIITQGEYPLLIQNSYPKIGPPGTASIPHNCFFSRTAVDGGTDSGSAIAAWIIQAGHRVHLSQCWASSQRSGACAIYATASVVDLEIHNSMVLNSTVDGIQLNQSSRVSILGCEILGAGRYCVNLLGAAHVRIVAVSFGPDPDIGRAVQAGISIDAASSSVAIAYSTLTGSFSSGSAIINNGTSVSVGSFV